jgi:glycosyltransferase 2 family protein
MSMERTKQEALFWPVLLLFMLVSLLAVLHWFLALRFDGFNLREIRIGPLGLACLAQVAALLVVALAWKVNLAGLGARGVGYLTALLMIGIQGIGKYTPGKVWGMVVRGLALYRLQPSKQLVVNATLIEQLALIHSGLGLALLAWLWERQQWLGFASVLAILPLSVWLVGRSAGTLDRLRSRMPARYRIPGIAADGFPASYCRSFFLLTLVWLLSASMLRFCVAAYPLESMPTDASILLASTLAYLGGFAAFFSLAGLGVREGILVALLAPQLGLAAALHVSLLHRLITAGFDVLLALASLALFRPTRKPEQVSA